MALSGSPRPLGSRRPLGKIISRLDIIRWACRSCTASARRFGRIFRRRGFLFLPLQTNWVMKRFDLEPGAPLDEMKVLTADGRDIGGGDAMIFLARHIWWAWPFPALARLPGMHKLLHLGYRLL